jgi:hypothetical protein
MDDRRVYVAVMRSGYSGDKEYIYNFYSESEASYCLAPKKIWQYQTVSIKSEIL